MLANEVGTGKTLTFLMERKVNLDMRLAKLRELGLDESDDATLVGLPKIMPCVIMAPANVVEQHFNECRRYFPEGTFHLRSYHGSASNTSHNPALQQVVMTTDMLIAEMELAVTQASTSQVRDKC